MSEPSPSVSPRGPAVRERLQELARLVRETDHLGPDVQKELADLLEAMAGELAAGPVSPQAEQVAETTVSLARELHEQRVGGPLEAAKQRVIETAARAEAKAPVTTGLALRLVDLLSEIGI